MISEPRLEFRPQQHFVAIRQHVFVPFADLLPPLWGDIMSWLGEKGLEPCGPPFIRYLTVDMEKGMDVEVGFPVEGLVVGERQFISGIFPAGRYACLLYSGPYDNQGLVEATTCLLDWAAANQISWETTMIGLVEWWQMRTEVYLTDPATEPDPQKWRTELVFLTAKGRLSQTSGF